MYKILPEHGHRKHKLYSVWNDIKQRCYNKNNPAYKYYGAKGITMFDEWINDYEWFYMWAIKNGYKDGLTIDRIDNAKGYFPNNLRWTDRQTQTENRSCNYNINFNNKHYNTLKECCDDNNLPYKTILNRIESGWDIEKSLTHPIRKKTK